MLGLNDFRDAVEAKEVTAGCNNWVVKVFQADSTLLLRLDVHLQKVLQTSPGVVVKRHSSRLLELLHDLHDTLSTQLPMVAALSHAQ